MTDLSVAMTAVTGGVLLRVKIVPGASRSRVMGLLGNRLKIAVAAPPEAGKANRAVCELLAEALGVAGREVSVTSGHAQPQKSVTVMGVTVEAAGVALGKVI